MPAWMENPTPIWPNVSHEGLEKGGRNLLHMSVSKGGSQLLEGEEPGQEGTEVLPEHHWADVDSLSVGHHAGKLQFEVTNVSEPSWGSPPGLRHDLFEGNTEKQ